MKRTPHPHMEGPCTKCGKMISQGYGSVLSGIFVCKACFFADPKLVARLKPKRGDTP